MDSLPDGVRERFHRGLKGEIPETAKPYDTFLSLAENTLIGNNRMSVDLARKTANDMGFNTLVLSTLLEGEASEMGTFFASIASEIQTTGNPITMPACIIGGGETTVTVRGNGKGGRNQEMALSAALHIAGFKDVVFLSGGTDGTDGPTDAAGGIVDGYTATRAENEGIDIFKALRTHNSTATLTRLKDAIITGNTGMNLMDLRVISISEKSS